MTESFSALEHRRLIDHDGSLHALAGGDLLGRLGGAAAVEKLVNGLYDGIETDAELRPLFSPDLQRERLRVKVFFSEFLGGEARYTSLLAHHSLKGTHHDVHVNRALAGRWLGHFRRALVAAVHDESVRDVVFAAVQQLAFALVNEEKARPPGKLRVKDSRCGREHPIHRAHDLIKKGNAAELRGLLEKTPELLKHVIDKAVMLQAAVGFGRQQIVELLLDLDVDPNKPASADTFRRDHPGSRYEGLILVTPLCLARWQKDSAVEGLLVGHGAKDDIFTAAFLGDVARLSQMLDDTPELARALDPACDALRVSPFHHAAAQGHVEAVRCLLDRGAELHGDARALRAAVSLEKVELVMLLLEHGADPSQLGPGDWVSSDELAPILARAGASVRLAEGDFGHWIWASCTGNNRQRDEPDYVRALLAHGARVDDRWRGATALHYAVKAGFSGTIAVLLELGADPQALDGEGRTPLEWLDRAGKSVDRQRVRRALGTGP